MSFSLLSYEYQIVQICVFAWPGALHIFPLATQSYNIYGVAAHAFSAEASKLFDSMHSEKWDIQG